jgi:NAD(P)-dependent dehydrogenase (short-subunit alcohol dehydrogenase family)
MCKCSNRPAEEGAAVVIADINKAAAQAVCDGIKANGGNVMFVETDVTDSAQVQAMVEATVDTHGSLDGAFNNAGIEGAFTNIAKMTEEEFDRTVNVDLKGVWLCVKYEIEQLMSQGSGGSIVSTASVAGLVGSRGGTAYCAAKHGVVGLTKSAALEYARKKIRVNAVCPGVIDTPMLDRLIGETGLDRESFESQEPMARFGNAREIGEAVAWLLSDQSSFVTGIAMPVDGGYTAI